MEKIHLLFLSFFLTICCIAQKPKIKWGEEFKLKKGSTDLEIIYADKSGAYLQEGHLALKSYFVIGATTRSSATLIKLDNTLSEVFRNDFNKELKGKEFEQFFVLRDKLFLIGSEYEKREKTLTIYAVELDKNSGELSGQWQSIASFQKDDKRDDINYKISLNTDSSRMIMVSSVEGKEKNTYQVQEFDKSLKSTGNPAIISNEFDPKTYQLEDVLYTINKRTILVGRVFQYEEGKRRKNKFLDFDHFNIRMYDEQGKQLADINTNINGRWLTSTKIVQEKNSDLVMAAFYSNEKKHGSIDGMLVQRIDAFSGTVLFTSEKQINTSLISGEAEDNADESTGDDEETKSERKERERLDKIKDESEGFSRYMQFRNIFYTSDGGLVILAEKYHHFTYTSQSYTPGNNGIGGSTSSSTYAIYECGDLLMSKIDAGGNIAWLQILPKAQRESDLIGHSEYRGLNFHSYFDVANRPFYAGFGAIHANNAVNILFNDNPRNALVTQPGQKVKMIRNFGKSDCFMVTLNELTGKYTRSPFFSNRDVPTSMPRLGSVIGQEMFLVGKDDRVFAKSKISTAKITLQ